ncbi:MAG: 23S rRNA (guanosine-2'-O-)-methyltransferase RlmB [Chlamydiia bacterium]|nr:23S rRNA (guanosine-2'-O-)-methyltransferase RlmB [Chlamydiia bacterium]
MRRFRLLTSRSNPKIKFLESLRKSKERAKENLYLVEGEREINRASKIQSIYFHKRSAFVDSLEKKGVQLIQVSKKILEKISLRGEIVAIGKMERKDLSELKGSFFVALVGVEKPGNIGAILRTCDGAGVDGVLIVDPVVDHYHPNAIRSSLGASFSLDIVCCSSKEAFEFLEEKNVRLVITSPEAKKSYHSKKMQRPVMIAFGQEDKGLPKKWLNQESVFIPMKGICDSLNVSVSVGILLYEVVRQNEL